MPWIKIVAEIPSEVGLSACDDWTGKASAAERRKIQNRVNVRALRRRKAALAANTKTRVQQPSPERHDSSLQTTPRGPLPDATVMNKANTNMNMNANRSWLLTDCEKVQQWNHIPMTQVFLAQPSANHLALLGRYNLSRAMATNMTILGLESVPVQEDCTFTCGDIEFFPDMPNCVPQNLEKTELAKRGGYEVWIDLFPCPALRDNLIQFLEANMDKTCKFMYDASGRLSHECTGGEQAQAPGLFVWSDPWSTYGWELTPAFIAKWAFLLVGCEELMESTSYWRSLRGEAPVTLSQQRL